MSYQPFERGGLPVGVRTRDLVDPARERELPVELWYPATDENAGRDLDPTTCDRYSSAPGFPEVSQEAVRDAEARPGSFPLVLFSHGFGGHRRQTTHWCTHLASHGYVVAAVDHTGNTVADVMQLAMQMLGRSRAGTSGDAAPTLDVHTLALPMVEARPLDVTFTIDAVLDGRAGDLAECVDPDRIAASGHSFGGWTTLAMPSIDARIGALVPMAPAGGRSPLAPEAVQDLLRLDWDHDVPTLVIAAEHDTLVPLDGVRELFGRAPSRRKRLVVLENADHMHFCDRIEEAHELFRLMPGAMPGLGDAAKRVRPIGELCPPEAAYRVIRGLGLAHLDAALRGDDDARAWLDACAALDLPIQVS